MIKHSQDSVSINRLFDDFELHRKELGASPIADIDMLQDVAQMISASSGANISYDKINGNKTSWKDLYENINLYLDSDSVKQNFNYCDFGAFVLDELLKSYNECYNMNSLISNGRLTMDTSGVWKLPGQMLKLTFSSTEEAQEYFKATKALVEKVIGMGADISKTLSALASPDPKIVKQSLEDGIDVNALMPNGDPVLSRVFENTIYEYESETDRLNVICEILNHNPDLSLKDRNGETIEDHKNAFEQQYRINLDEYRAINAELSDLSTPKTEQISEASAPHTMSTDEGKV